MTKSSSKYTLVLYICKNFGTEGDTLNGTALRLM
jgi:hypothetical protein